MDERTFQRLASEAFRAIGDALETVDPDLVDFDSTGDVVTLTLRRTHKCVVNTQRAARQIWLAANARGWHFSWDPSAGQWLDDKGGRDDLLSTLARIIREASGVELVFPGRTAT